MDLPHLRWNIPYWKSSLIYLIPLITIVLIFVINNNQTINNLPDQNGPLIKMEVKRVFRVKRSREVKSCQNCGKICNTKECKKFGKQFKKMIDESVNPCDNFYEFVCGKYAKKSVIPTDMISAGSLEKADEKVQEILRQQLSQPIKKYDLKPIKYASKMFKGCNDQVTLESRGVQPLIGALKSIGGWPLIGNKAPFNEKTYDRLDALAKMNAYFAESGIFDLTVLQDFKNNTKNILYFGSAPDLLFRPNLFRKMNYRTGKKVPKTPPIMPKIPIKEPEEGEDGEEEEDSEVESIQLLLDYILGMVKIMGGEDSEETRQQIFDIMVFSGQLGEIQNEELDVESEYNKITLKELNELTSNKIDWLKFINKIYSLIKSKRRFKYEDHCVVTDVEYFRQLPKILSVTSDTVIANFLGFILIKDYGDYSLEAFRKHNFHFQKELLGIEKQSEHWKTCLDLVRSTMPFAISRKFVKHNFPEKSRAKATELVDYIQKSFYELIERNTVLDRFTRRRSMLKLRAVTKNVGYPKWLFDNQTLERIYDLRKDCKTKKVFECIVHLMRRLIFKIFDSIDKPVNKTTSWPMDPTTVNAAYVASDNSITIPAAIINALFASDNPREVNFARMGLIIGHELTHGFDSFGSKFDENGNLQSIWDQFTQDKFEEREKCFIDQYNSFCDLGFCVNGENTKTENTADNGGIREAYRAYKIYNKQKGSTKRLPYLSQYTSDQIFFISSATLWCDNVRPEALKNVFADDEHSPSRFRVNGVLSNFQSFANAFNCPINSSMNPINKCVLW